MRNEPSPNGGNGEVHYTAARAPVIETTPPASHARPEGALGPYLRAIRAHRVVVPLIVLAALVGAILYLALRSPSYEANADILITPLPQDDQTFIGVQVVRDSPADPTRTVQTAANLIDTPQAAGLAAKRLGDGWTLEKVQSAVDVEPKGGSNILSATATVGTSGAEAAKVANEYARSALDSRADTLKVQIDLALKRLRDRSEEHTSELQSHVNLVCRLLLEKK